MHIDIVQRPLTSTLPGASASLAGHQIWLADGAADAEADAKAPRRTPDAMPAFRLDLSAMNRVPPASIRGPQRTTLLRDDDPPTLPVRSSRLVIR